MLEFTQGRNAAKVGRALPGRRGLNPDLTSLNNYQWKNPAGSHQESIVGFYKRLSIWMTRVDSPWAHTGSDELQSVLCSPLFPFLFIFPSSHMTKESTQVGGIGKEVSETDSAPPSAPSPPLGFSPRCWRIWEQFMTPVLRAKSLAGHKEKRILHLNFGL